MVKLIWPVKPTPQDIRRSKRYATRVVWDGYLKMLRLAAQAGIVDDTKAEHHE